MSTLRRIRVAVVPCLTAEVAEELHRLPCEWERLDRMLVGHAKSALYVVLFPRMDAKGVAAWAETAPRETD